MANTKESNIGWIGTIPNTWKIDKVKYHFTNNKYIPGIHSSKYDRLALTLNGVIHREKEDVNGLQPKDFNTYQLLRKGELVFKLIDLQNISTSRVGLAHDTGLVSPAYIVLQSKDMVPEYAEKFFLMMWHNQIFNALGDEGVRSSLNATDLLNTPIVVPSLPEQEKIAKFLDSKCAEIDALHKDIEKQIETLEEYKKLVITEAVTKGLTDININGTKISFNNESDEQWECKKLKLLTSMPIIDGPHESPELFDDGIPYISATAIVNGKIDFNLMRGYISEEYCSLCDKRYKPQLSDILVVKLGAGTGQVAIVDEDRRFNIWVPLAAVRCNESVLPKFIYYGFQSDYVITQMEQSWTYGTQETLGVKTIERLKFFVPTLDKQNEIVKYLDSKCEKIDGAISEKKEQLEVLEQYKKSLIYEYVTGKKEVPANE